MVAEDGTILEGLSSNFFAIRDGALYTEEDRVLPGLTRSLVLEVAAGLLPRAPRGLRVDELPSRRRVLRHQRLPRRAAGGRGRRRAIGAGDAGAADDGDPRGLRRGGRARGRGRARVTAHPRSWHRPMTARDPHEPHRASTPLELLFDLCFVVAVAQAAAEPAPRHRRRPRRRTRVLRLRDGVLRDLVGLDELHLVRLGLRHRRRALPPADAGADGRRAGARRRRPARRSTARDFRVDRRSATSSCASAWSRSGCARARSRSRAPADRAALRRRARRCCRSLWLGCCCCRRALHVPAWVLRAGVAGELAVPLWAERAARTPWHPHHIAERYGLFTLIVLGESILAATRRGAGRRSRPGGRGAALLAVAGGGCWSSSRCGGSTSSEPAHERLARTRARRSSGATATS